MRVHVGLAIGADRLVASIAGRDAWSRALEPQGESDSWPDLARALAELRDELRGRLHEASIAILPRLVQLRRLELPRLREDELRRVVTRDAARYFVTREPQVVAVCSIGSRKASPRPVMAAAMSARALDAIEAAAGESGWRILTIAPAHAAWLAAARERSSRELAAGGALVCVEHGSAESMTVEAGRIAGVRRAAAAMDLTTVEPPNLGAGAAPSLLAAQFASRAQTLALVPERVIAAERRRATRSAQRLAAVAATALIAAAGVEYWGLAREVRALQAQRAEIREVVQVVVETRDAIAEVESRLATLARLERSAPRWSAVIASVAEHLPVDAYLSAFRARADTLLLEGVAQEAAGVFEAMQQAPGVAAVRANAPIRQELRDGTEAVERFALAARLASPSPGVDR